MTMEILGTFQLVQLVFVMTDKFPVMISLVILFLVKSHTSLQEIVVQCVLHKVQDTALMRGTLTCGARHGTRQPVELVSATKGMSHVQILNVRWSFVQMHTFRMESVVQFVHHQTDLVLSKENCIRMEPLGI